MWLWAQSSETPAEYAVTLALHLRGALDTEALDRAVDAVVRRHDSLRSCFPERDGVPARAQAPAEGLRLRHAAPEPGGDPDEVLRRVVREQIPGLDLAAGPLFRPVLVPLGAEEHRLVVVLHHIVADGWSAELLLEDIAAHYRARTAGEPGPAHPAVSYQRYVDIERRNERDGVTDRHLEYFTAELRGIPDEVTLPLDRPRPPQRTGRGATLRLGFGPCGADAVRRLADTHRTTPFVILLAGLSALLHRAGGHEDVVIGSAVAGRFDAEVDDLVGLCLNSVALRWPVGPDTPFATVVERAENSLLGAMDHSAAPLARAGKAVGQLLLITVALSVEGLLEGEGAADRGDPPGCCLVVPAAEREHPLQQRVDVLLGGGRERFEQAITEGPERGATVLHRARQRGYQVITEAEGLDAVRPGRPVLGLFAAEALPVEWTGRPAAPAGTAPQRCVPADPGRGPRIPSLEAQTRKAIELLEAGARQKGQGKGFFLQVEGASIDKQNHDADPCGQIGETVAFDRAVKAAREYAVRHPDTLVITTADHGHSSQIVPLAARPAGLSATLITDEGALMKLSYATHAGEEGQEHSGVQVRVAAEGPHAHRVLGSGDQTELFTTLRLALGLR